MGAVDRPPAVDGVNVDHRPLRAEVDDLRPGERPVVGLRSRLRSLRRFDVDELGELEQPAAEKVVARRFGIPEVAADCRENGCAIRVVCPARHERRL
jgi:hypothetical protein